MRLAPLFFLVSALSVFSQEGRAESVFVKYRGVVDLKTFDCSAPPGNAVVKRICYDQTNRNVVVRLVGTYYEYCGVPPNIVASWRDAPSSDRYYDYIIKGHFDCRTASPQPSSPALPPAAPPTSPPINRQQVPDAVRAPAYRSHNTCESGHWVDSVMEDGSIVRLEDGSLWEVDAVDTVDSALWLPTTEIIVCDGKLINTEDKESVSVRRLR